MRRLVAYWTFTCDRDNRKESVEAKYVSEGRMYSVVESASTNSLPPGWGVINGKDLCPDCARLVRQTLEPTLTRTEPDPK